MGVMTNRQPIELIKINAGMSITEGFERVQCKINEMIIEFGLQQSRCKMQNGNSAGPAGIKPVVADDLTVTPYQQVKLIKEKINELIDGINHMLYNQETFRHAVTEMTHKIEEDVGNIRARINQKEDYVRRK